MIKIKENTQTIIVLYYNYESILWFQSSEGFDCGSESEADLPDNRIRIHDSVGSNICWETNACRAGTRYKRRGVDEAGHVANFVETEQILLYHTYALR